MVDRVAKSDEFVLGILHVKVACVATSIESGKQVAQGWSASSGPGLSELNVVAQSFKSMHATIRSLVVMNFTSYLCLGELGLADLHRLCSEEEFPSNSGVEGATLARPRQS